MGIGKLARGFTYRPRLLLLGHRPSSPGYFSSNFHCSRKWNHASSGTDDTPSPSRGVTSRPELLEIVDQYDDTSINEHLEFLRDPYLRRYAPADGPYLTVSDRREDVNLQSIDARQRLDPEESEAVRKLREIVLLKLRRPATIDLDEVYDRYLSLPGPRASHITARLRHQLLAVLGMTERKNSKSMLRYFSVVTDVKNSGFPLTRLEWNTAMSFASRYVGRSTEVEVEAALHLWREMEQVAGIRASDVTFNILFDVASKAGKFNLAEMIYQEMMTRGFQFNRYHHVSLIHYFGLKQDTSGMRAAYREMVESGEVIDSIVLNSVISGFLTAGEEDSAEKVYEKMKLSARGTRVLPDRNYSMQKNITKVLMMFARVAKKHPEMRPNFQQTALISPDLQTYRLLINHYGPRLGNLSKVAQFLDEMKLFEVQLHGAIFLALFKAFGRHGSTGSDWSAERLVSVWNAFLDALDSGTEGFYISTWAMAVLRAFSRFSTRDQMLDIYESLRSRWDLDTGNSQFMMDFLTRIMQQDNFLAQSRGISF
ncbi:putative pentatricopeptide repeat protein [Daldinia childiae]|uniref:putative pentatricopeptide repeat protein n=1 Tax=Daldinia childiae TaxID=326645 RepID=UPI00144734F1|nr:putative pentatricopeptide repeat protein [Daldinia childiae]KAF3070368.1 putative pentatricopeptide repeat protein [Daldinia childiae]